MEESQALLALSALSQQTRLQILRFLVTKGPAGASAGDVGKFVEASSSRASFHLSSLNHAGLITATRQSRSIIYKVDFEAMAGLIGYLVRDCCNSDSTVLACCTQPDCNCQ